MNDTACHQEYAPSGDAVELAADYAARFGDNALATARMMERHVASLGRLERADAFRAAIRLLEGGWIR